MTGERIKTWWRCMAPSLPPALRVECEAHGVYMQAMNGGDAEKHTKATGHSTESTIRPDVGERWMTS